MSGIRSALHWKILFGGRSDFWFAAERVSAACELITLFGGDLDHLVPGSGSMDASGRSPTF
jgi:CII-binding regulator of phage lambda lysogenization HflD